MDSLIYRAFNHPLIRAVVLSPPCPGGAFPVAVMGPADQFGELSLFDPGPRTATAVVVTAHSNLALAVAASESFLGPGDLFRSGGRCYKSALTAFVTARRLRW